MSGLLALTRLEIVRVFRNRRVLFFSVLYPTLLFLVIGNSAHGQIAGIPVRNYYMVAMALFGALGAALMNNAQKIAQERTDGWIRQLKLTALPGNGYVIAKVTAASLITLPSIAVVFLTGAVFGVRLEPARWLAAALAIWAASFAFTALGIAIGYAVPQDSVQLVSLVVYLMMSILGGLWFPISGVLSDIGKVFPSYTSRDYTMNVISGASGSTRDLVITTIWVAAGILLAGFVYQRDAKIES